MFKSKSQFLLQLKAQAGKLKTDYFDFSRIEHFFLHDNKGDCHQVISDKTWQDLDFNEVFMFLDRTMSAVGQQVLYKALRTIPASKHRIENFEKIIQSVKQNPGTLDALILALSSLNKKEAYHISPLFLGRHIQKPNWFAVIPALSLFAIVSAVLSFFYPSLVILLLILLTTNFGIHYWNKANIYQYSSSIPQLLRLNETAKTILKVESMDFQQRDVQASIRQIDALGTGMLLFKLESKLQSELGQVVEYLFELLKALFLIEPLILFHLLGKIDKNREHIRNVFEYVGNIDAAVSIHFLRADLTYFCTPAISLQAKHLQASAVYHPLIFQSVANDFDLQKKSGLLTGSNMSGKTTFIRTIGINAITAQTINTCFAKEFAIPHLRIHSAIRITDDLLSDRSYYLEEVMTVKGLLDEIDSDVENLFLLDELFKGTNTIERIASAKAILTYLNKGNNIAIAATHDLELAELLKAEFNVYHFTEILENGKITFDYKIKSGPLRDTNAIRILALNEYPEELLVEANELATRILQYKTDIR